MLFIYNETKTPWRQEQINERLSKFIITKKINDEKIKRIEIVTTSDVLTNGGETFVNLETPVKIYDGITGVLFQKKDCAPMVTTTTKYSKDIMLFNINLKGSFIKNITTNNVFILSYMVAKSEFSSVLSISDTEDISMVIELHNPKDKIDTTYTLVKTEFGYDITCETKEAVEIIEEPSFKIHKFRPAKPTCLILTKEEDYNTVRDIIGDNIEKHTIKEFRMDTLEEIISESREEGYRAVTLFHNVDFIDKAIGEHYSPIRRNFQVMNILLNNGKIIKR